MSHTVHCLSRSGIGGAQEVVYTLVHVLQRTHPGDRVTVVLPPGGVYVDRFKTLGVRVETLPLDRLSPGVLLRLYRLIRILKPDVIHSHGKGAGLYARLLPGTAAHHFRVHSYHGFHPPAGKNAGFLYRVLESLLLRRLDRVIAVSPSEAEEVLRSFPQTKGRINVIANCVDPQEVRARSNRAIDATVRHFLDAHAGAFVIAIIGRNDPVKDFPLAFDAFRKMKEVRDRCVLLVVGLEGNDPDFSRLMNEFPDQVLGMGPVDNAAPMIQRSSVLLFTSKKEGGPLTVLEAFVLGKPVVATNVPGLSDLISDGMDGLLCDRTPEFLARALGSLVSDPALYHRLCDGALATASRLNVEHWGETFAAVYAGRRSE